MITLTDLNIQRSRMTLDCGANLIYFYQPGMPVSLEILIERGGRHDPIESQGLTHFCEHFLLMGTKNLPTVDELARYVDRYGGSYNAFTSSETLGIDISIGDPKQFEIVAHFVDEVSNHQLLTDQMFNNVKSTVLQEWLRKKSDPSKYIWEVARKLLFQTTDLEKSVIGSEASIEQIQLDNCTSLIGKLFDNRFVIVGSGGTPFDEVAGQLNEIFKGKNTIPQSENIGHLPINTANRHQVQLFPGSPHTHLFVGFRTCENESKDIYALSLIKHLLTGSRASQLMQRLRYQEGLVYGVNAILHGYTDAGMFGIVTSTAPEKVQTVLDLIGDELIRIKNGEISDEAFSFAKDLALNSKRMYLQTASAWVDYHAHRNLYDPDWTVETYNQQLISLTRDEVSKVAEQYFSHDKWFLALCGDVSENAQYDFLV